METISVIIPAYNAEATIVRACRSVLEQSHKNVELLVVNDGSRDGTGAALDALAAQDSRLKCIHKENGGVSAARNSALEVMTGEYFTFLDSDDEMEPGALESLLEKARETGADVVCGSFSSIKPDGTVLTHCYVEEQTIWTELETLENSLKDHPATHTVWGKLYRSSTLGHLRFEPGRNIHEDGYYVFEAALCRPKMVVTDIPVIRHYLRVRRSAQEPYSDKFLCLTYFADKKYERIEKEYPRYLPLAENIRIKGRIAMLNSMRLVKGPEARQQERMAAAFVRSHARYYIPESRGDKITFWAARLGLMSLYRWLYCLYARI